MSPTIRPVLRRIIGLSVGFLVAIGTITAVEFRRSERSADQAWVLAGNMNAFEYCMRADGNLRAVLRNNDAFGWRCMGRRNGIWGFETVDVALACVQQYGPKARAETSDSSDPMSWRCLVRT
jgi:hypothetical protein